tara:strand:+ start:1951 stop:2688 length:738 start_codon:yes stop_codon:yes gene_type:complete
MSRKLLPKLRKIDYTKKKHHYHIKDPFSKRKLAIHEGVSAEARKTKKNKKQAAVAKKGRFNILRIYRKNKKPKECRIITHDMRYMDKKYGLGKTKNICGVSLLKKKRTTRRGYGGKSPKRTKRRTKKLQFLYNPNNPKKSFDVYINKNPSDTIPIKYTTVKDVKRTIKKLESLFKRKAYPHKRIWQVGMILKVRLEAMKKHKKTKFPNAKNVTQRFNLANSYFKFLGKRSKLKTFKERKALVFKN